MDFGGGEGFLQGGCREDRGQAAGEHGLARPRRPDHEQIVPPAGSDFEGALGVILAAHVRKVNPVVGVAAKHLIHVQFVGPLACVAGQNGQGLAQRTDAIDERSIGNGGLAGVLRRHDHAVEALLVQGCGHRQHPVDRADAAVEREFAQERELGETHGLDLPRGRQDADGDGQVKSRAFLFAIGRREIDGDLAPRPLIASVFDGC